MRSSDVCPFCRGSDCPVARTCRDFLSTDRSFAIRRCGACGFSFTDPRPDETEIAEYYASPQYAPLSLDAKGWIHVVSRFVRRLVLPSRVRMVEKAVGRRGRILDIGCGTGEFPAAAARRGWQATAVEPDERGRRTAIERHGVDARDLEGLRSLPDRSFDAVTLWHVLEHVHDVGETLAHVARLLKPGGAAVIAVPNHDCVDAERYGDRWFAYDVPRHLSHFTLATLRAWIERAGLRIESVRGSILDTAYIALRSQQIEGGLALRALPTVARSAAEGLRRAHRSSTVILVVRHAGA